MQINLEEKQREALDAALKGENVFISGKSGVGKAGAYYSPILTPDGIKTMREIVKGSYVIGRNGKPTEVLEVYPQKNLDIYRITFENGDTDDCCKDHLWTVQTDKLKQRKSYRTLTTIELLQAGLKTNQGHRFNTPSISPVEFTEKQVNIHPYLLGYLLGDGWIPQIKTKGSCSITCHYVDFDEVFARLSAISEFKLSAHTRRVNVINIGVSSLIKPHLQQLGLLGTKSRTKFVPKDYLYNSIENRKLVLAGLLDTDSHCQRFKDGRVKIRYSTSSEMLAKNVKELVLSLGGIASITKIFRKGTYEYNVPIRLPFNPYLREKKKQIYGDFKNRFDFTRKIVSIDYIGKEDGQCILVNADDHLYLTGNYVPTHNTYITKEIIKRLEYKNRNVVVLATTGIAAQNIGGSTIHSFFRISPYGVFTADKVTPATNYVRALWLKANTIIIDEVSMLRPDVADAMYWIFSGNEVNPMSKQWIFVGDLKQLQPIVTDNEKPYFVYEKNCVTASMMFSALNFKEISLDVIKRQSNPEFITNLNRLRDGLDATKYFNQFLNKYNDGVFISPRNNRVDEINKTFLNLLDSEEIILKGVVSDKFKQNEFAVQETIVVKDGAKIMYLKNEKNGLVNGSIGTLCIKNDTMYFEDANKFLFEIKTHNFEKKEYEIVKGKTELVTKASIVQYPIKLCWGITVHKCVEENTLIYTKRGLVKIKDIANNDYVNIGNNTYKKVLNKFDNGLQEVYKLTTNCGYSIECTFTHELLDDENNFKPIQDFLLGDKVFIDKDTANDNYGIIQSIEYSGFKNVFDLEIEDIHQYIANGFLSHNCQGQTFSKIIVDEAYGYFAENQQYVAISRVTSPEGLCIIKEKNLTIVYNNILKFKQEQE